MADMPPGVGQPPTPPGSGPPAPGGAPAFGTSPATGPTANAGQSAGGKQILSVLQSLAWMALGQVGPSSPEGVDLRKAMDLISKHVPAGSVSPAAHLTTLKALMMRQQQQAPQIAQMQGMAAKQMAGAPQQPPAAPPQAA